MKCNKLFVQHKETAQLQLVHLMNMMNIKKVDALCQPDVRECASENLHKTQLNAAWFEKSNLSRKTGLKRNL